jgi:CRISPR/Cas system-associated exonuclease Cas4 (RecB family)
MTDRADIEVSLVPARMLNELIYCPRLFHLEWVQGEFVDNHFTVEGQSVHRRVDRKESGGLPVELPERPFESRSVTLSSTVLGITGKIDLVEVCSMRRWWRRRSKPYARHDTWPPTPRFRRRFATTPNAVRVRSTRFACPTR